MIEDRYLHDWSQTRYGIPQRLERPRNTTELQAIVAECHAAKLPLVIQGGRTGVVGGAAPSDGEVIVSMERMGGIEEFDENEGLVVVNAGMILSQLQEVTEAKSWLFPLDLGSRGSCQIGGNVATNAGGSKVIKYGSTRQWVLGLEAVLGTGRLIGPPNRLLKNNAGYSLSSLLVGSEGTLGVISRVALRLTPLPTVRCTALLSLHPQAALPEVLRDLRQDLPDSLAAFEVMWPSYLALAVRAGTGKLLSRDFSERRAVLLEIESNAEGETRARLENALARQIEKGAAVDAIIAQSSRESGALWHMREAIGEIQSLMRPYVGFDVSLPLAAQDKFVALASERIAREFPEMSAGFFGHAGDSNLHALIGPCPDPKRRHELEATFYGMLERLTTSVSAEHGIGRKKKPYLAFSRTDVEIETMKALKRTLDPANILNRGRIFDLEGV